MGVPLTHELTGNRFRVIALGTTRGVMHCMDQVPELGMTVTAACEDSRFHAARLTFVVLGPEDGFTPEFASFRLVRVAAPSCHGLREALKVLAPGHEVRLDDDPTPVADGFLMALDPDSGRIGLVAGERTTRMAGGRLDGRRQSGRQVLEVSSRKGARPRPKRGDEST